MGYLKLIVCLKIIIIILLQDRNAIQFLAFAGQQSYFVDYILEADTGFWKRGGGGSG